MAVTIKVEPIDRDIKLMLDESVSPKARSLAFAEFAREQIDDARETNRSILGRSPRYTVSVDGRIGALLDQVRPDGVIIAEFELVLDALQWIADQLDKHSPVGGKGDKHPGLYKRSHVLFADGQEVVLGQNIPVADEYVFVNTTAYARPIERGWSSQAPEGVYQAVAHLAASKSKFGNIAKISFEPFRGFVGGSAGNKSKNRNPAISVKFQGR